MNEKLVTLALITLRMRSKYVECVERKKLHQNNESLFLIRNAERLGYLRIFEEIRDMVGYPLGILLKDYCDYKKGKFEQIAETGGYYEKDNDDKAR